MNPASPLQLDDEVEIIGPDSYGDISRMGKKFKISELRLGNNEEFDGVIMASRIGVPWYPASSLRKVEELQIGDQVKIIGPDYRGNVKEIGEEFKIEDINEEYGWYSSLGMNMYPASSLRKLTPNEIQHVEPIKLSEEAKQKIENVIDEGIIKLLMEKTGARLFAIEEHLKEIGESHAELIGDVEDVGKRLAFVEAFQKDEKNQIHPWAAVGLGSFDLGLKAAQLMEEMKK